MRSYHFLFVGLLLLFVLEATTVGGLALNGRQEESSAAESSVSSTATADAPRGTSATAISEKSAPTSTEPADEETTLTTAVTRSTDAASNPVAEQTSEPAASNGAQPSGTASPAPANSLPIHPRITPAMGLAGVILLISGAVYALIGIKNRMLYVSFSAAYLTSLAVSVLIVYLMTPPVSDATQGGFFVAVFLTGIIFGVIAIVFSDITDGLGCLLGGFCLSMWFLTVKEGGLIKSTTGRAIFIGCMSAAAHALSFSHYTRNHGLIVSISFAGSTVTMLGIDCFSRAGWKEFWLYLWGLNENIFPLGTGTYPITRGIKVEIAGVVLFAALGIMSQLKLWKIVKERREKSAEARVQRHRELQKEEEEVGRRVRDDFKRERIQWEAVYSGRVQPRDSIMDESHRSSPKTPMSTKEKDISTVDGVEMVNIPLKQLDSAKGHRLSSTCKHFVAAPTVTVEVLREDDEIQPVRESDVSGRIAVGDPPNERVPLSGSARVSSGNGQPGEKDAPGTASTRSPIRTPVSSAPAVVPLPFEVPTVEDDTKEAVDTASVSVAVESVYEAPLDRRSSLKRFSGGSLLKRLSTNKDPQDDLEETLTVPHIEDDRASSLAATLDDDLDVASLAELSTMTSRKGSVSREPPNLVLGSGTQEKRSSEAEAALHKAPTLPAIKVGIESAFAPEARSVTSDSPLEEPRREVNMTHEGKDLPTPNQLDPSAPNSTKHQSLTVSTDPIPESTWARGTTLDDFRKQGVADVRKSEEDSQQGDPYTSDTLSPTLRPAPLHRLSKDALPEKLSKVALSYRTNEWAKHLELAEQPEPDAIPEPESPGMKVAHGESPAPVNDELTELPPLKMQPKRVSTNPYRDSNLMRSASNMSRQSLAGAQGNDPSQPAFTNQNRNKRSSSTPLQSTEMLATAALRLSNTPSPAPGHTLLGKRESLVRNKMSSALDSEMTPAERKKLIQQQKSSAASQQQRQSHRLSAEQMVNFDSHQPRRVSGGVDPSKREVMLAKWRESMRQDSTAIPSAPVVDDRSRRSALMHDKRQKEIEQREQAMKAQQRDLMLSSAMRSNEMMDAHREAMRRMQAKANRTVS